MQEQQIARPHFQTKLANGFQERQALDVTHRPADLHDHDVAAIAVGELADGVLDLVRDVRMTWTVPPR